MNTSFQIAYLPIGVPTFDLEAAQAEFEKSKSVLRQITENGVYPDKMLLSLDDLDTFLEQIHPDLAILQNITFANASYVSRVMKKFHCPILLWTLREPATDGNRLRLNSLTGAYSAGNAMMNIGNGKFQYVFGAPDEIQVQSAVHTVIRAAWLKKELGSLRMASIGHTPEGFGFGRASDSELLKNFGVELESVEARELITMAESYSNEDCVKYLEDTESCTIGFRKTLKQNQIGHGRLLKAYCDFAEAHHIGALASRCWPDYFTLYGTPVCTVLSMLNDRGIAAACEADTYGALSMFMGMKLTGSATFFGDPVSLNEKENTITYWHCGMAACSLADPVTGAQVGLHPNRRLGPVMDFACRGNQKVTIFRIGRKTDGNFRFFLASGKALDRKKQFSGTSVVVQTEGNSKEMIENSVKDGWEPHFVVIYGDVKGELAALADLLGMEVCNY